jgi:predicted protein tyrosine phosphatase
MRVLFVCTQNLQRSPTAEALYGGRSDLEVRSAGITRDARVPLTAELLQWADAVYVMEEMHRQHIERAFPALARTKRIVCLDIPDRYYYMEPDLVALLEDRLQPELGSVIRSSS